MADVAVSFDMQARKLVAVSLFSVMDAPLFVMQVGPPFTETEMKCR